MIIKIPWCSRNDTVMKSYAYTPATRWGMDMEFNSLSVHHIFMRAEPKSVLSNARLTWYTAVTENEGLQCFSLQNLNFGLISGLQTWTHFHKLDVDGVHAYNS